MKKQISNRWLLPVVMGIWAGVIFLFSQGHSQAKTPEKPQLKPWDQFAGIGPAEDTFSLCLSYRDPFLPIQSSKEIQLPKKTRSSIPNSVKVTPPKPVLKGIVRKGLSDKWLALVRWENQDFIVQEGGCIKDQIRILAIHKNGLSIKIEAETFHIPFNRFQP